jgi:hypothetical protein
MAAHVVARTTYTHNLSDVDAFVSELETRGWNMLPPKKYGATYDLGGDEALELLRIIGLWRRFA